MPMCSISRLSQLAVVLLAAVAAPAAGAQKDAPGAAGPLSLQATCVTQGSAPLIRAQVANTGSQPRSLVLGFVAEDGKTHVVDAVQVSSIRIATGAEEIHFYVNPAFALASGPPWIVTLAPGATHVLELPIYDFVSTMNYARLEPGVAGGATLVVDARPAKGQSQVWTGKLRARIGLCLQ